MNNLLHLIRADLREFNTYKSARSEIKKGSIWLNANESPFDVELQNGVKLNRYPQKQPAELIEQLSSLYEVNTDQIAISRGSDEMIDLLIRLFCTAGTDTIMTCPPTYGVYGIYAQLQGCSVIEVPLRKDRQFQLDVDKVIAKAESDKSIKIIFICSPNNPTGNLFNANDILNICKTFANKAIVVVDEAYIDFADCKSLSRYITEYENLVILRTLSKAYGLAGVRFGILLANKHVIQWIIKIMAPYPLPSPVIQVVSQALSNEQISQVQQEIACIKSERARLVNALSTLPIIKKVWPSEGNFLLINSDYSESIMEVCAKRGIVLRSMFDKKGLENCIRISVGLPEENTQVINALKEVNE